MAKKKEPTELVPSNRSISDLIVAQAKLMIPKKDDFASAFKVMQPNLKDWNSTGSFILDYLIGQREYRLGLPGGRLVDITGFEGVGKSGLAYEAGAAAQQAGGFCAVVSSEPLDPEYAECICGLNISDPSKWFYAETNSLEGATALIEAIVLKLNEVKYLGPVVIIWDCVSACGVKNEQLENKDTHDNISAAANAKYLHNWFRRGIMMHLANTRISLITIRHETASPRDAYKIYTTHGNAINYAASLRLRITKSKLEESDMDLGNWRKIQCIKSKVGIGGWKHEQPTYHGIGRDPGKEVFQFLKNHKAIQKDGNMWVVGDQKAFESEWVRKYRDDPHYRAGFNQWALNILKELY